ncbi:MAG: hypothetical protein IPP14_01245 [Planctomycetes bacterium]|nr:hypothetical protein [Planctomycetota bacterium]
MRVLLMLVMFSATLSAQDQNYWNQQYGTRSRLLGGAVVGGCDDTSAGFYNPARLAWIDNPSLSVSGTLYQMDRFFIEDGAGRDRDLAATNWRVVPSLVSGIHLLDFAPGHAFAHTIMARNYSSNNVSARRQANINVIDESRSPGNEDYTAQLNADLSLQEYWAGLSWAWKITDWLSVGATSFGALRIEKSSVRTRARAVWFNGTVFEAASVISDQFFSYTDLRALAKGGIAIEFGGFKAGLTITTEAVHLWGQGTASRDVEINNVDTNLNGVGDTVVFNDRQENRRTEIRSPWSFAMGLEYRVEGTGTRLCVSTEYFLPVGNYVAMRADNRGFFQGLGGLAGGSKDFLQVRDSRNGVMNVAFGVSQEFGEWLIGHWTGYWGFNTDFSADVNKRAGGLSLGGTDFDLYHGATGVSVRTDKSEFAIGVHVSVGSNRVAQNINFDDPTEPGLLFGASKSTRGVYWSVGLAAGYTYFF